MHMIKKIWKELNMEITLTVLYVGVFEILMWTGNMNNIPLVQTIALGLLGCTWFSFLVEVLRKRMTWNKAIMYVMISGLIVRCGYNMATNTYSRYHDYGDIEWDGTIGYKKFNAFGHAPYILFLYIHRTLAQFNTGQFYQPPLFHTLAAIAMRVTYKLVHEENIILLLEAAKMVSCLASCYTLMLVRRITKELALSNKASLLTVGTIAFLPMFTLMGGWINNDALVFFFMTWIVLFTIRWDKKPTVFNTIMLALGFGLGMMSKISCVFLAFFTGLFMLKKLVETVKNRKTSENTDVSGKKRDLRGLIGKFVLFGAISFPIGLFYPIRNYLKFGQPLNYVLRLNLKEVPVQDFLQRFVLFPFGRLFSQIFALSDEYNLNMQLLKTASFGEFEYPAYLQLPGKLIVGSNLVLIILAFIALIVVAIREKNLLWSIAMPVMWSFFYISELHFSVQYPYTCTMDCRYVTATVLFGAMYIGKLANVYKKTDDSIGNSKKLLLKIYLTVSMIALTVLGISGSLFLLRLDM